MLIAEHPPFRPFPTLRSAHLQTLGAYFFRRTVPKYRAVKHTVNLFDGDRLVLHDDQPESWITGDRIVILFHGLCGCHRSPYVARIANKLNRRGIRTFRIDMRGLGDSSLISRSHLHGGCYQDVESVIQFVYRLTPLSKMSLVGFSIGGNVILKTLGRWAEAAPDYVDSAIAVSPPVDLIHASWNLRQYGNRIYELQFMNRLKTQLTMRRKRVKNLVDNKLCPLPTRLVHWYDQFTAPCWGYSEALEYYEDASSCEQLHRVSVPTIILAAQDDPIVPYSMYSEYPMSDQIEMVSTRYGGHLGFIGANGQDPDRYWMDWRVCHWVMSMEDKQIPAKTASSKSRVGRPYYQRPSRPGDRSGRRSY